MYGIIVSDVEDVAEAVTILHEHSGEPIRDIEDWIERGVVALEVDLEPEDRNLEGFIDPAEADELQGDFFTVVERLKDLGATLSFVFRPAEESPWEEVLDEEAMRVLVETEFERFSDPME